MKIITKVTLTEYRKLMYQLTYRKPSAIYVTILGVAFAIVTVLFFIGSPVAKDGNPIFSIAFALFTLGMIPYSVYRSSAKNFNSNHQIQERIEYNFTDDILITTGESFHSERDLKKAFKIIETNDFFLIYESAGIFNMIPKKSMSLNEINELRDILRKINITGIKKLK